MTTTVRTMQVNGKITAYFDSKPLHQVFKAGEVEARLRQLGWMKRMLEQQLCKELQITDTVRRSREVQDTNRKIQKVKAEMHKLREKHW